MLQIRKAAKFIVSVASLATAFIPALSTGFGSWKILFVTFAQGFSIIPGPLGDYLRTAYYRLTLNKCALSSRVSFGSFFAHADAEIGDRVYIGPFCVLGSVDIGAGTLVSTGVQILSGKHQHGRTEAGEFSHVSTFTKTVIGANCWIGSGSIVMADIGECSTIGAGSVVARTVPPFSTAVGNPARVIHTNSEGAMAASKTA